MALIGLCAATALSYLGSRHDGLDVFANLRLHLGVGALILVLLAIALRQPLVGVGAAVVLVLNAVAVVPQLIATPSVAAPALDRATFRALSFNVWVRNERLDDVIAFLKAEEADLVILAEVVPALAQRLDALRAHYPYQADCADRSACRIALLSRYPLSDVQRPSRAKGMPAAVAARMSLDGRDVTVVGTHLTQPFTRDRQAREVDALADFLNGLQGPILLAGDFNATPWSANFRKLTRAAGLTGYRPPPATWPSLLGPLGLPIDHILVSSDLALYELRSRKSVGSDHLPVAASIRVR